MSPSVIAQNNCRVDINNSLPVRILKSSTVFIGIILGLLLGSILIVIAGADPIEAYKIMFTSSLGGKSQIIETLLKACPLLLIGLGLATSFRTRVWNIGAEGQYYIGALFGGTVGLYCTNLPQYLLIPLMIIMGIIGGALWGLIPALFKIKKGMNEIISTLMLNYIAILIVQYLSRGPLQEPGGYLPRSAKLEAVARMPKVFGTRLHIGCLIALILIPIVYYILWSTPLGFKLRAVGSNFSVAKYAGFNVNSSIIFALVFSGALSGMAGVIELSSSYLRLQSSISLNYGFNGILVALLGRMNPFGVLIASIFFAAMTIGAETIHVVIGLPVSLSDVIQALVVLSVMIVDSLVRRRFS
ncbi:MAG: ABC transporter permease [Flexilinea sp.]|jgi:simple sugar transport system permease protein